MRLRLRRYGQALGVAAGRAHQTLRRNGERFERQLVADGAQPAPFHLSSLDDAIHLDWPILLVEFRTDEMFSVAAEKTRFATRESAEKTFDIAVRARTVTSALLWNRHDDLAPCLRRSNNAFLSRTCQ